MAMLEEKLNWNIVEQNRKIRASKSFENIGGAPRDRTDDLIVANDGATGMPTECFNNLALDWAKC